jgi:hypothetical protein
VFLALKIGKPFGAGVHTKGIAHLNLDVFPGNRSYALASTSSGTDLSDKNIFSAFE